MGSIVDVLRESLPSLWSTLKQVNFVKYIVHEELLLCMLCDWKRFGTGLIFASDCAFVLLVAITLFSICFCFVLFVYLFVCLFLIVERVLHSLLAYPIIMTHLFRFWNGTDVQWRVCSWKSPSSGSVSTSTTRRLRHSWKSFEKGTTDGTQNDYWNGKFVILRQKFPGFSFISPGCWWNPDEALTAVLSGPHIRGQERRRVRSLLRILGT